MSMRGAHCDFKQQTHVGSVFYNLHWETESQVNLSFDYYNKIMNKTTKNYQNTDGTQLYK